MKLYFDLELEMDMKDREIDLKYDKTFSFVWGLEGSSLGSYGHFICLKKAT